MQDRTPKLAYLQNPKKKETWADLEEDGMTVLKTSEKKERACTFIV
jgi:hypothetical protein